MDAKPGYVIAVIVALTLFVGVRLFFTETEPPTLSVEGLASGDRVGPGASVSIQAADARLGVSEVIALLDGNLVLASGGPERWSVSLPDTLEDGPHKLVVVARDRSWNKNEASQVLRFDSDSQPPRFRLAPSTAAAQGRVVPIFLSSDEPAVSVEATAFGRPLPLIERDGLWVGLTGAGVSQESGELVITAEDSLGNRGERRLALSVEPTAFLGGGVVTLDARRQKNQKDDGLRSQDREKRKVAYAVPQPEWLIEGAGELPVEGRLSSPFGKIRTYNTGVRRHHLGTDIAIGQGTPVKASGAGVVALAELLPLHGNAVVLRHGPSLSTSYNHLHTMDVAVGDTVKKGDIVGTVGSTGQSTGPHLHWGMVAGGVAVAAESWLDGDLLTPTPEDRIALEAPWSAP
jgi:hypothetical protein